MSRSDQAHGPQILASSRCSCSSGCPHFSEEWGEMAGGRTSVQHHGQWPLGPGAGDEARAWRLVSVPSGTRHSFLTRKQQPVLTMAHVPTELPSAPLKCDCVSHSFSSVSNNLYLNNVPKCRPAGGGSP